MTLRSGSAGVAITQPIREFPYFNHFCWEQNMSKAIRIQKQGGPEVMQWEDVEVGEPGAGQARVRHHACGLNYIDVRPPG